MKRIPMALSAAVAAAALVLSGCSDDDSGSAAADAGADSAGTEEKPASPEAEQEEPEAEGSEPEGGAEGGESASADAPAPEKAEVTKPGTELKLGDRAVVPYEGAGATGTIGITVTKVTPMDKAAFDAALGDNADPDITPFCVHFTIDNADGSDLGGTYPPDLTGTTADGGDTGAVVFGAEVDGCDEADAPDEFAKAGATYETARVQGAGPGAKVAGAAYEDEEYEDEPIVWTP